MGFKGYIINLIKIVFFCLLDKLVLFFIIEFYYFNLTKGFGVFILFK